MAQGNGTTMGVDLGGGAVGVASAGVKCGPKKTHTISQWSYAVEGCVDLHASTLLSGTPSSLITANDWAANASFNSNTSTSSSAQPAFSTCRWNTHGVTHATMCVLSPPLPHLLPF